MKIDAWPHQIAADPRQNQGIISLVLARIFPLLQGPSWYIPILVFSPEYSSDVRKDLDSLHLLEVPLLGLQELQI